jgi:hypothetical protein
VDFLRAYVNGVFFPFMVLVKDGCPNFFLMNTAARFKNEFCSPENGRRNRIESLYLTAFKFKKKMTVVKNDLNISNDGITVVNNTDAKPDTIVGKDFIAAFISTSAIYKLLRFFMILTYKDILY